jgi:hypothetical protein
MRERYCMKGDCSDSWPPWSEDSDCSSRPCAVDCYTKTSSGSRNYCNLIKYLKTDPSNRCLPTERICNVEDTLIAPFWGNDYYNTTGIRLNQYVNGQTGCIVGLDYDSNYVGSGTITPALVGDGWLPISLTDNLAIVHDYHYYFTCGEQESIWADESLYNNILHIKSTYGENQENIYTANEALKMQTFLGTGGVSITPGPSGMGEGWTKITQKEREQAAEVLNAIDETGLIVDWAFFDYYRCGEVNPITGKRKIVLDKPRCGGIPSCPPSELESRTYC